MVAPDRQVQVTLDQVPPEHTAIIRSLTGDVAFQNRLRSMGFIEGETVGVVKQAPLSDPVEYSVRRMHISLRRAEARQVLVADPHRGNRCRHGRDAAHRHGGRLRRRLRCWLRRSE